MNAQAACTQSLLLRDKAGQHVSHVHTDLVHCLLRYEDLSLIEKLCVAGHHRHAEEALTQYGEPELIQDEILQDSIAIGFLLKIGIRLWYASICAN